MSGTRLALVRLADRLISRMPADRALVEAQVSALGGEVLRDLVVILLIQCAQDRQDLEGYARAFRDDRSLFAQLADGR